MAECRLTVGKYAICCDACELGLPRVYFDRKPRYMYTGHREAVPKLARCVESDHSMIGATEYSRLAGSSGLRGCSCSNRSSASMASEL